MKNIIPLLLYLCFACSCSVSKGYSPGRKYSPQEMQKDYQVFRNVLEESHPSLYWYTPKDSVDYYFNVGASQLSDSLPEYRFRNILSYVIAQIKCGHTSVKASKAATNYAERTRSFAFPLSVKAWNDTVVVTSNLNRKDTTVTRGVLLKSIEGRAMPQILDSLFKYLPADGYNTTHKYQTVSNAGVFRNMYGSIYGLRTKMNVEYIDTTGMVKNAILNVYNPITDTPRGKPSIKAAKKKEVKKMYLEYARSMKVDTSLNTAFMEVNTFTKNNKLRSFFKHSFKEMRKKKIKNLVIDIRSNGGGSVVLSNLLTRYIADAPFKIADSLYALKRRSNYGKYEQNYILNRMFLMFMAHKRDDGHYHFTYFENKYFKPKKKNHFEGTTYILTGGNTFSAATLFACSLKKQQDVVIVGEETGGGAYGNTAWLIPDITLPNTKVRFRLPLFRLVIDKDEQKGRGVMPEVEVKPTVEAIRRNEDYKMNKVIELIKEGH